jgi:hypothetical protein
MFYNSTFTTPVAPVDAHRLAPRSTPPHTMRTASRRVPLFRASDDASRYNADAPPFPSNNALASLIFVLRNTLPPASG